MQLNILFSIKSILENTVFLAKCTQRWLGQKNFGINEKKFEQKMTTHFIKETFLLMM